MTNRFFHNGQCCKQSRNCRRGVLAACSCCLARVLFRHRVASSLHMVPPISSSLHVSCTPTPGLQGPYGRWAEWQNLAGRSTQDQQTCQTYSYHCIPDGDGWHLY